MNENLAKVLEVIKAGRFGDYTVFAQLIDTLTIGGDYYLISYDFSSYLDAQDRADRCFAKESEWVSKTILSAASMGKFSSDRSIKEYAERIWNVKPCRVP